MRAMTVITSLTNSALIVLVLTVYWGTVVLRHCFAYFSLILCDVDLTEQNEYKRTKRSSHCRRNNEAMNGIDSVNVTFIGGISVN